MPQDQGRVGAGVRNGGQFMAGYRTRSTTPPKADRPDPSQLVARLIRAIRFDNDPGHAGLVPLREPKLPSLPIKVRQLRSMSAKVAEYGNGNVLCTSYKTPVAAYVDFDKDRPHGTKSGFGAIVLSEDWERSNTTMNHVSAFLQEVGGNKLRASDIRAQIANGSITIVPALDIPGIVSSNQG